LSAAVASSISALKNRFVASPPNDQVPSEALTKLPTSLRLDCSRIITRKGVGTPSRIVIEFDALLIVPLPE
jgi:hypothetical protein